MKLTIADILDELTNVSPEILNYLEYQLEEWAKWYRRKDHHGLDFSPITIEYKIMKLGCLPRENAGSKVLPTNEIAEEMEAIIGIMFNQGGNNKRNATALREYYLGRGRGNQYDAAKMMGVAERNFRQYLKQACSWLVGWFTCKCAVHIISRKAS